MSDLRVINHQEVPFRIEPGALVEGRFELGQRLGQGGCAVVYQARQLSIDRDVALKFLTLDPEMEPASLARFKARFEQEARSAGKIPHPDIVNILDYGVVHGNQPFIVMELLQGRDLRRELALEGAMAPARALPLFVRCLDALSAAHAMGIVHKDLKPSNLFLTGIGTLVETLRIVDFGIATVGTSSRMTEHNQFAGTAAYCAPEYYQERVVSPALDVYQMGLILAELLTGRPAVPDADPVKAIFRHLKHKLDLSEALLRSPIGPLIRQATAYHPGARFPDAAAFRDALAKVDARGLEGLASVALAAPVPILPRITPTGAHAQPRLDSGEMTREAARLALPTGDEETLDGPIDPLTVGGVAPLPIPSPPSSDALSRSKPLGTASGETQVTVEAQAMPLPIPSFGGSPLVESSPELRTRPEAAPAGVFNAESARESLRLRAHPEPAGVFNAADTRQPTSVESAAPPSAPEPAGEAHDTAQVAPAAQPSPRLLWGGLAVIGAVGVALLIAWATLGPETKTPNPAPPTANAVGVSDGAGGANAGGGGTDPSQDPKDSPGVTGATAGLAGATDAAKPKDNTPPPKDTPAPPAETKPEPVVVMLKTTPATAQATLLGAKTTQRKDVKGGRLVWELPQGAASWDIIVSSKRHAARCVRVEPDPKISEIVQVQLSPKGNCRDFGAGTLVRVDGEGRFPVEVVLERARGPKKPPRFDPLLPPAKQ